MSDEAILPAVEPPDVTVRRYDSAEAIDSAYWSNVAAEIGEELALSADDVFGCIDQSGNEVEISRATIIASIKDQGVWGFVDDKDVIHFWAAQDCPLSRLAHFFSHELGHKMPGGKDDHLEEELRAEGFAAVATRANELALEAVQGRARVVCAAIRNRDGLILCGARHFDSVMVAHIKANPAPWRGEDVEQGFIDQRGNFLTREQAHVIAVANGQIFRRCGGDEHTLYSENLY